MEALNFNSLIQPTWSVTLRDEANTTVDLVAPTVELVDRLTAMAPELQKLSKSKDEKLIRAAYELVAEIMSCNANGITFTADEIRGTYKLNFLDLLVLCKGYMDFIVEIKSAKN